MAVDLKKPEFSPSAADEFIVGDLRNRDLCFSLFQDGPVDEVYQLAADMGGAGYVFVGEHDFDIMHNSAMINLNMAECGLHGKYKKIFYSSSACIYPEYNQLDADKPVCTEESAYPAAPDSEYGWEKLFSERMYLNLLKNYGVQVRIARFHNIFGPEGTWRGGKEKAPAAISRKVAETKEGGTIPIWGDGFQTRSFLYIDECLEGVRRLMEQNEFIGPVNIGSEEMVTINHLTEMIMKIAAKKLELEHIPGPLGVRGRNSDNRLIKEKLGWAPATKLEAGLRKTYDWIEKMVEQTMGDDPLVSVVTVVYNNAKTIANCIESVLGQSYKKIEYIIVDGASTDSTLEVVRSYGDRISKVISEPDDGIYDAMNKGIKAATGDVVAILNSDDMYADENVLANVVAEFEKGKEIGCVYGDLDYVDKEDVNKIHREWRSKPYRPGLFRTGWHPAHPSFFVRKEVYDKHGLYLTKLGISADYEMMLRLLEKEQVLSSYIPRVLVKMRTGGHSNASFKQILRGNAEVIKSWKVNKMQTPYSVFFRKPLSKLKQLAHKKIF